MKKILIIAGLMLAQNSAQATQLCCKLWENKFVTEAALFTAQTQCQCEGENTTACPKPVTGYVFYASAPSANCPICCGSNNQPVVPYIWENIAQNCKSPNYISWSGSCTPQSSPTPSPSVSPSVSPTPSPSPSSSPAGLCCNLNTGMTVPASPRGCVQGQALTPVTSAQQCIDLCIQHGGPGGNGNTSNCGHPNSPIIGGNTGGGNHSGGIKNNPIRELALPKTAPIKKGR